MFSTFYRDLYLIIFSNNNLEYFALGDWTRKRECLYSNQGKSIKTHLFYHMTYDLYYDFTQVFIIPAYMQFMLNVLDES